MRTHYGPWQPCWISNQHQKHKSGRGPSSEHFWQVWLISVQRFQRRRFKCEKLTDGRRTLTHDKSSHGLWPGELIKQHWLRHSFSSDKYFTVFYMYVSVFILSVKLAKINYFNTCIKISGNNFITYKKKKTNLVIFNTGKNFRSKIRS